MSKECWGIGWALLILGEHSLMSRLLDWMYYRSGHAEGLSDRNCTVFVALSVVMALFTWVASNLYNATLPAPDTSVRILHPVFDYNNPAYLHKQDSMSKHSFRRPYSFFFFQRMSS